MSVAYQVLGEFTKVAAHVRGRTEILEASIEDDSLVKI